jgi:hypothetical protein
MRSSGKTGGAGFCHRAMVRAGIILIALQTFVPSVQAQELSDGRPFGPINEVDVDQLMKFGRARGFDLQPEMQRIYKKDEEALARLFKLSLSFKTLNRNARTYGQMIYSSWLRLGETYGVDSFLKVLDRQPEEVQQRVRDYLYYPLLRTPKEKRKDTLEELRRMHPRLFPSDFQFGRNDPVF